MGVLMSFLIILLAICIVLGIMLAIAFVRLGKELRRLGDDTESLIVRAQRATQTVQVALPLIAVARKFAEGILEKRSQLTKRKK
jgi:hypothetical protein